MALNILCHLQKIPVSQEKRGL